MTAAAFGALGRDLYRWLTPSRPRSPLALVLDAFACSRPNIYFVQIGSNDGDHGDPLRTFISKHQWQGIMIEPVPYVFERLRRNYRHRQDILLENVAIADHDGHATFYCLSETTEPLPGWYDQLGSFTMDSILKEEEFIPNLRDRLVTLAVPCLTFESLCQRHGVQTLDLVHIDAEGHDYEVIKLIDFPRFKPSVVLYEHKHLNEPDRLDCIHLMGKYGYATLEIGSDTLCVRHDAMASRLSRLRRAWTLARRVMA